MQHFLFFYLALSIICTSLLGVMGAQAKVSQAPFALTMEQRQTYLKYYAPILFKKADEGGGWAGSRAGRGWMTNFDFDNDQQFGNNKENWERLQRFMDGDFQDWNIRPTVYSAIVEYTTPHGKEATLLYHPYFPKQKGSIHDWERIEIKLSGITGEPGGGEQVDYVVITQHHKHNFRKRGHEDLNFMPTTMGRHVMIWRADQTTGFDFLKPNRPFGGELHFVEDTWWTVSKLSKNSDKKASVDINGHGKKGFHYIFVPESDIKAVGAWKSQTLTNENANNLASGRGTKSTDMDNVKRVSYELQDLADILPTHWAEGSFQGHWRNDKKKVRVLIEDPLSGGLDGGPDVPSGLQLFFATSVDSEDSDEKRKGYIYKHWFWGSYMFGCGGNGKIKDDLFGVVDSASLTGVALDTGAPNGTRMVANGDPKSAGRYFYQHDYFVHTGQKGDCSASSGDKEIGFWLERGWDLDENGGFDGRWVQLFPD